MKHLWVTMLVLFVVLGCTPKQEEVAEVQEKNKTETNDDWKAENEKLRQELEKLRNQKADDGQEEDQPSGDEGGKDKKEMPHDGGQVIGNASQLYEQDWKAENHSLSLRNGSTWTAGIAWIARGEKEVAGGSYRIRMNDGELFLELQLEDFYTKSKEWAVSGAAKRHGSVAVVCEIALNEGLVIPEGKLDLQVKELDGRGTVRNVVGMITGQLYRFVPSEAPLSFKDLPPGFTYRNVSEEAMGQIAELRNDLEDVERVIGVYEIKVDRQRKRKNTIEANAAQEVLDKFKANKEKILAEIRELQSGK